MNPSTHPDRIALERAFDVLLKENKRILQENERLRQQLLRNVDGTAQVHAIDKSLANGYPEDAFRESACGADATSYPEQLFDNAQTHGANTG